MAWNAKDEQDRSQKMVALRDLISGQLGATCRILRGTSLDGSRAANLGTAITEMDSEPAAAGGFALEQNYPNPFNPKTVVSSQLPVASNVKLLIYDVLGREVKVLVNERRAAGRYEDIFDASSLSSGVYFYRLSAGSFVQTRKMVVLK